MTLLNMMNYVQNNKTMGNKTIIDTLQLAYKYTTGQRRDRSLPRPTWLPDGRSWVNSSSMAELGRVCRRPDVRCFL
jgi:hypothetical protein